MNLFTINYAELGKNEKKQMYYDFSENAQESFNKYSDKTQILAQLLFINRVFNSYSEAMMKVGKEMSVLMKDALNMLWDYLENKCDISNFEVFSNGIDAVTLFLNTGEEIEVGENLNFWEKYSDEWHYTTNSILLLNAFGALFFQIHEKSIDWYSISEDCLLGELNEIVGSYFEDVYTNPTDGYKYDELELRIGQICESSTFVKIMSYIIKDMKEAVNSEGKGVNEITRLRAEYKNKFLFSPIECERLAEYFK
ncbi:hypothetical protein Ccar_24590 [Clostridium carboxidivorans P7]|uniref:Uncharacterized protein n=1 Tax=Clostridium carboxidivorans P7 TaxID=536227 RepID=C6PU48_9CLOT|nr:hypothetical protein [Clostridium carboxidivorans]AKN33833.1 hypothetical protein Ccar_24590 [Clostridium carboxidivorans P7]EET87248.1 hypothetical protein CcarbDRAFT_2315 [Clostridium carboxidivorans P7]EFG86554.1 hypothetical protein CLCAR_3501 [Clostridium carboxidivorans P7]